MTGLPDPSLRKMRVFATSLLVVMAVLYCCARTFEGSAAIWPWIRAFAEAAMVGALADWFAVTALFRHPLGLPIPHTAIVRREKKRIGAAVSSFVRRSFLTPEEATKQWMEWRPISRITRGISDPLRAEERIDWCFSQLPGLLSRVDREKLAHLVSSGFRQGAKSVPMARLVTIFLRGFLKSPGRRGLIAPVIGRVAE